MYVRVKISLYHQLLKCVLISIIKMQKNKKLEAHFLSKTSSQLLTVREELDLNDLILLTVSLRVCLYRSAYFYLQNMPCKHNFIEDTLSEMQAHDKSWHFVKLKTP